MPHMQAIQRGWNTGDTTPHDISPIRDLAAFYDEFKSRTGAEFVARILWVYNDTAYDCEYPAEVLPDASGIVVYGAKVKLSQPQHYPHQRFLKVLNPDATLRCRVDFPEIDDGPLPAEYDREIRLPERNPVAGIEFGVPVFPGRRWIVMEVDWQTGAMKRWVPAPNYDR